MVEDISACRHKTCRSYCHYLTPFQWMDRHQICCSSLLYVYSCFLLTSLQPLKLLLRIIAVWQLISTGQEVSSYYFSVNYCIFIGEAIRRTHWLPSSYVHAVRAGRCCNVAALLLLLLYLAATPEENTCTNKPQEWNTLEASERNGLFYF